MIKLSDRLRAIADSINKGEIVADIGTDHGFLPIYLYERAISPHVILSDINQGPLEKARENIEKYCPSKEFDIRLGSGLTTLEVGEVNTVVIAGMGGLLISDIIGYELDKSKSYKKYILQPRNAQDKLRRWLFENNFSITDEKLVKEGKYICEIIIANTANGNGFDSDDIKNSNSDIFQEDIDFEISPILLKKKDSLLVEFIQNKIRIENNIMNDIIQGGSTMNHEKIIQSKHRMLALQKLAERSGKNEHEYE